MLHGLASDSIKHVKTGLTFGALPAIAFDTDIGFKYGLLTNFYLFGDGSTYPKYRHSFYMEANRTTKGSGLLQFIYDSEYLIPKIRLTAEASYFTEQALDFYGFNGYQAWYDPDLIDPDKKDNGYISRVFYKHDRRVLRLRSDFQGQIIGKKFRWLAGFEYNGFKVKTVDIDKLNKGKNDKDILPQEELLYDKFVKWGVIRDDEKSGGNHTMFKFGLVYDTRDNEPNPMRGMWSEIILLTAPSFTGNEPSFTKLAITHRHYFTLVEEVLNLAVRLSYQPKIGGRIPFYALPYVYNTNINILRDGLGGANSMRGILRNRVVGEDMFYGHVELRWKFLQIHKKQYIYFALSPFVDFGQVTRDYKFETNALYTNETDDRFKGWFAKGSSKDAMHFSYGAGISGALNHNFVAHVNYGRAVDKRDGKSGLYIGLNYLF
jgi:outer membrane protein assembly factor BamA